MEATVYPVILSGGVGKRLWPMSRALWPKQLLPLVSERSMLQATVERVTGSQFAPPLIICNDEHRFMIAEQMREIDTKPEAIVLEPVGRNTAPAVIVAALLLAQRDANAVMLVLPSDHVIRDQDGFNASIDTAVRAVADREASSKRRASAHRRETETVDASPPESALGNRHRRIRSRRLGRV